jgi:hypothetical protein
LTDTIGVTRLGTEVVPDSPSSSEFGEGASQFKLAPRSTLSYFLVAGSTMAALCIRNHSVFSRPIREQGDEAANSILVNQAVHFHLLVGNYSREGFNHPGPAFLYIQSFGQDLFYSWLHAVPAPFNGQLIALFLLNSAILALTVLVIARHTRSWSTAVLVISVVVLLTGSTLSWTSAWFPYLYAAPFLLAMLSGVSVAIGALQDLPIFTFAVGLLVHGHVAFIGIMGIYVALVVVAWLILHRNAGGYGTLLQRAQKSLIASGAIVLLFALPIAVELGLHWPGQFGQYWHYVHSSSQQHHHSFAQVATYIGSFWPGGPVVKTLLLLAGVGTASWAVTDPNRSRRNFVLEALLGVVILTLQMGLYAYKGVDFLNLTYTGYFYYSVPPVILATLLVEALGRFGAVLATPAARHKHRRLITIPVVGSAVLGILLFATRPSTLNTYWGEPALPHVASVIRDSSLRDGRTVAFSMNTVGTSGADWPDVVGLLVAASWEGYQPCIADDAWQFIVTSQYICTPTEEKHAWLITAELSSVRVPSGGTLVFRNTSVEVFANPKTGASH